MVSIIAKVTEACNSRCAYCDVVTKATQQTATMSNGVLERMYQRINEYLLEDLNRCCEIIWHGGEPLLAGVSFYKTAIEFRQKYCSDTQSRIQHSIQSNLTLMQPVFIPVFRKLGMTFIGTSYDPISNIRGLGRARRSDIYNRQFMWGVQTIEEAGFGWGAIYVVTKMSLLDPIGIFHFMTNLNPNASVMFNPVILYGEDLMGLAITAEEYVDFLGTIFPIWWKWRERYRGCQPFQSLVDIIADGRQSLNCSDAGVCHGSHLNISPNGSASICGRAADWGLLDCGSIFDQTIKEIIGHSARQILRQRDTILSSTECLGCRFWPICHGGCPLDSWAANMSFHHKTPWCYVKRGFIEKYFEPVTGIHYKQS